MQRTDLFRYSVAGKLNELFSKRGIAGIHGPQSRPVVRVHVDLGLGNRTVEIGRGRSAGVEDGALAQIDSVLGSNYS